MDELSSLIVDFNHITSLIRISNCLFTDSLKALKDKKSCPNLAQDFPAMVLCKEASLIKQFLDLGVDPDITEKDKPSPLLFLVMEYRIQMGLINALEEPETRHIRFILDNIRLLVKYGANIAKVSYNGLSPFGIALELEDRTLTKALRTRRSSL